MDEAIQLISEHGCLIVFAWVLAEQIGLPAPSTLILLAAGTIAGSGLTMLGLLSSGVLAAVLGDLIWFRIGRKKGILILGLLCRISLDPDYCVRRAQERLALNGEKTVLIAKFVPGLSTAALRLRECSICRCRGS